MESSLDPQINNDIVFGLLRNSCSGTVDIFHEFAYKKLKILLAVVLLIFENLM